MLLARSLAVRLLVRRAAAPLATYRFSSSIPPPQRAPNALDDAPLADWLLSLQPHEGADSNKLAEEWIAAIRSLREDYSKDGAFDVNKAFAPEGAEDFDFFMHARADRWAEERQRGVPATAEMQLELEAAAALDVPEKRREMMNMLTNHIMRNGKKNQAYKQLNRALYLVYLKKRTDPAAALLAALDAMAPLVQLHKVSDGGARVETLPVPYHPTKRIGKAWKWVIDASKNRQSRDFSVRLAEEIIAAIEGKSSGYEKRALIHRDAVANRSIAEGVVRGKWKTRG